MENIQMSNLLKIKTPNGPQWINLDHIVHVEDGRDSGYFNITLVDGKEYELTGKDREAYKFFRSWLDNGDIAWLQRKAKAVVKETVTKLAEADIPERISEFTDKAHSTISDLLQGVVNTVNNATTPRQGSPRPDAPTPPSTGPNAPRSATAAEEPVKEEAKPVKTAPRSTTKSTTPKSDSPSSLKSKTTKKDK